MLLSNDAGLVHSRHLEYKEYMLSLINDERRRAGLKGVTLGDNTAAQLHAEASIKTCTSSHWGVDGLKPYMRYTLAGGSAANSENIGGLNYCYTAEDRVTRLVDIENELDDMMSGWMESKGHRDNILDPFHKKVNIGLAWDDYNIVGVQHFAGDYLEYSSRPVIHEGLLTLRGRLKNQAAALHTDDLSVNVYYDPPPQTLTRGQLSRTFCYDEGMMIASFRPPISGGWIYEEHEFVQDGTSCPNPYRISENAPSPTSPEEALDLSREAYERSASGFPDVSIVKWVTARRMQTEQGSLHVVADLSALLNSFGAGIYTVSIWAKLGSEDIRVSSYSIFHGVAVPRSQPSAGAWVQDSTEQSAAELRQRPDHSFETYTVGEVVDTYEDNPFAGDQLFKGKVLNVTGVVVAIVQGYWPDGDDLIEINYMTLATKRSNRADPTLTCVPKKGDTGQFADVRRGQVVTVRGEGVGDVPLFGISLRHCTLVQRG